MSLILGLDSTENSPPGYQGEKCKGVNDGDSGGPLIVKENGR